MRTDTIFYQLFQTLPGILFELIGESANQAEAYQFASVEIKELAFRFDGLFLPLADLPEQPIYFVEVQFQPKTDFYWRLFAEIFVYLNQYQPIQDWRAVAVFAKRSLDPGVPMQYRGLLMSQQVTFVYLDELDETANTSLGLGIVQLVVEEEATVNEQARQLLEKAQQELEDVALRQKVLELIETILVYKLTNLSREEIEAMFGLSELKQTRYFREVAQDAKKEGKLQGKLETVPLLLELGLTVEQIAERLSLDVEAVRKAAQTFKSDNSQGEDTGI